MSETGTNHPSGTRAWVVQRVGDVVILAAGLALALPLILPFG